MKLHLPAELSRKNLPHEVLYSENPEEPATPFSEEEFEAFTGMHYLPHLAFSSEKVYRKVCRECAKAPVSSRAPWLGEKYRAQIETAFIAPVKISYVSEEMGWGLFALEPLNPGDFIGEYTGVVRPITFFTDKINPYCFRYPLYGWRFIYYTIDARKQGNEISFVNHAAESNCESVVLLLDGLLHVALIAKKSIAVGEQLFYDYGKNYWRRFADGADPAAARP